MPLDPRIPLMAAPNVQLEPPLNAMLRVQQLRRGQQEEQLNALQAQRYQDEYARTRKESAQKTARDFYANVPTIMGRVPKEQRPQVFQSMLQQAVQTGIDPSLVPQQWTPELDALADAAAAPEPMNAYQQAQIEATTARDKDTAAYHGRMAGAAELRAQRTGPERAPIAVIGADGKPVYVSQAEAVGREPYTPPRTSGPRVAADPNLGTIVVDPGSNTFTRPTEASGLTTQQTAARDGARLALQKLEYDPETDQTAVDKLIPQSTSGSIQKGASNALAVFGASTEGKRIIAQLTVKANALRYDLLNGKLGTGISNADVQFLGEMLGDVANPSIPWETRYAAWQSVKDNLKILARQGQLPPRDNRGASGDAAGSPPDGVTAEEWAHATPEERKLWQK